MQDRYLNSILEVIASEASNTEGPHLITVDELRAAGALDVPAAWRKSLRVERNLFTNLFEGEDARSDEQQSGEVAPENDESADEIG